MSDIRIVLLRTGEPLNIGAVARAMKNCELSDLVFVEPQTDEWVTARRVAVHAGDLLATPRIAATLAEAVADCAWVVGTTSPAPAIEATRTPSHRPQRTRASAR